PFNFSSKLPPLTPFHKLRRNNSAMRTPYARRVNSQGISNGKKKGTGNTMNGNQYLYWAFVEAAYYAQRFCVEAKRFYERNGAVAGNHGAADPASLTQ
ncbi:MAG: hypothetical protein ABI536_00635, partial [Gallionella sp.]